MAFNLWMKSVIDAGRALLRHRLSSKDKTIIELSDELCSIKGEAVGVALADAVIDAYYALGEDEKLSYFETLLKDYSPDPERIIKSAQEYQASQNLDTYKALYAEIESPRRNLFQRINMSLKGIPMLVHMREDLQTLIADNDDFRIIDQDLKELLTSWFNRGFLELRKIDWTTSAEILEKLISYEAVHVMDGWDDLRSRLQNNRTLYAFFHPLLENEPLIFVEVALVNGLAGSIQSILSKENQPDTVDTAIFYSISNCQEGLKGISFGNFLIKQVVMELMSEFQQIKQFATLSPIPGFTRWLKKAFDDGSIKEICNQNELNILQAISEQDWGLENIGDPENVRPLLEGLCAHYLYNVKRSSRPIDPVARFHLGNGALIERINWLGDTSLKGQKESASFMVNYKYDLARLEENHEMYVNNYKVACSVSFLEKLGNKEKIYKPEISAA